MLSALDCKMKSIKNHISNLNQTDWDYYSEGKTRTLNNPFTSRLSHIRFVSDYFKRSEKESVLEINKLLDSYKLSNNRLKHTNSIFFLGVLIYNNTNLHLNPLKSENTEGNKRFSFLWFLSCLFHDFAFEIENDEKAIEGINNLDDLKKRYSITNCLLETEPKEIYNVLFSVIENYFNYRLKEDKQIDHGILAGLYFFDRLVKNRMIKSEELEKTLFWGKELEEQYSQVATAISVHNIWLPEKINIKKYKDYGLDNLITNYNRIKFTDFPLLYILGIVDTIDPMKTYMRDGIKPNEILENIELQFSENTVTIKNGANSKMDFTKMTGNADKLKIWIDVDVDYNQTELKLTIK